MLLIALPTAAFFLGRRAPTPTELVAAAAPPPTRPVTAAVELRELEAGEVFRGSVEVPSLALSYEPEKAMVVTEVHLEAGEIINEGDVLFAVDDQPVFIMRGNLPLIERIDPGARGSIVRQLQEGLKRLGLFDGEVDGLYGRRTQAAIKKMYETAGYALPAAETSDTSTESTSTGTAVPAGAIAFIESVPIEVLDSELRVGQVMSGVVETATLLTGAPVVEVSLRAQDLALFPPGGRVLIRTDRGVLEVEGTVASVDEIPAESGASSGWVARITPAGALDPDVTGTSLQVVVGAQATEGPVLVVPITAIRATADGQPYVLRESPDAPPTRVAVEIGLESGGFVAVTPLDSLEAGDRVLVGEAPLDSAGTP